MRTVNDVVRTAEWRFVKDLLRPLPVLGMPLEMLGGHWVTWPDPHRAVDRSLRITRRPGWVWGYEGYEEDRTTYHSIKTHQGYTDDESTERGFLQTRFTVGFPRNS